MIKILGLAMLLVIILDGWSNKWAIMKAIGSLFANTWKKISGKL
jgi:hypothetical protein